MDDNHRTPRCTRRGAGRRGRDQSAHRRPQTAARARLSAPQSAHAIGVNIREGFGRGPGGGRAQSIRVARGEAEETIGHLRSNFAMQRLERSTYWRLRNRLVVINRMLNSLEHS
ncbi:MAG TPA: four helix bundle protein [Gemmatimonadaceae bacterium]|nr:four helix bundle protein [Gemmatimonadaceae bacterium]